MEQSGIVGGRVSKGADQTNNKNRIPNTEYRIPFTIDGSRLTFDEFRSYGPKFRSFLISILCPLRVLCADRIN